MALTCKLDKSILRKNNCAYTLQNVKDMYLVANSDISKIEMSSGDTPEVSAITLSEMAKWAKIEPSEGSASFSDTLNVIDAGGKYRTHSVSFSFSGEYNGQNKLNLDNLALGTYAVVAVLASGQYILLGDENVGLSATVANNVGAGSATEFSGIQVEMSANVTHSATPLTVEAIDAIKANVVA